MTCSFLVIMFSEENYTSTRNLETKKIIFHEEVIDVACIITDILTFQA